MEKKCKSCGKTLPIDCFTKSKNVKDGYENKCKQCRNFARLKYKNTCDTCGKTFLSQKSDAKYCSTQCKPQCISKRIKVKCAICGKEKLVKKKYSIDHTYFYCSRDCASIGETGKRTGEKSSRYSKIEIQCDCCGKTILRIASQIKKYQRHYCSKECEIKDYKKRFAGSKNPMYKKVRVDMQGENNWAWNPNRTHDERVSERKTLQNKRWRRDVFEKDNYTCKNCGIRGQGNIVAHHLDSYDIAIEKRYDVDNGAVLCEKCHKLFHKLYGYGHNTKEQFFEYIKGQADTEPSDKETC